MQLSSRTELNNLFLLELYKGDRITGVISQIQQQSCDHHGFLMQLHCQCFFLWCLLLVTRSSDMTRKFLGLGVLSCNTVRYHERPLFLNSYACL